MCASWHTDRSVSRRGYGGPQVDEVRKQVLITDERLLINDCPWFAYLTLLRHLFAVKIKIFRVKLYIYEIKMLSLYPNKEKGR